MKTNSVVIIFACLLFLSFFQNCAEKVNLSEYNSEGTPEDNDDKTISDLNLPVIPPSNDPRNLIMGFTNIVSTALDTYECKVPVGSNSCSLPTPHFFMDQVVGTSGGNHIQIHVSSGGAHNTSPMICATAGDTPTADPPWILLKPDGSTAAMVFTAFRVQDCGVQTESFLADPANMIKRIVVLAKKL